MIYTRKALEFRGEMIRSTVILFLIVYIEK